MTTDASVASPGAGTEGFAAIACNGAGVRFFAKIASLICAAGFSAALITHALLQGIAALGAGASSFEQHGHGALEPAIAVELALLIALLFIAIKEYRATAGSIAFEARTRVAPMRLFLLAGCIAVVATTTLFGMEVSESAAAAAGLGWLGGSLFPGAPILALVVLGSVSAIKFALDGRYAGLARLLTLLSKVLCAIGRIGGEPVLARVRAVSPHIVLRSGFGASAGLRAPPLSHI